MKFIQITLTALLGVITSILTVIANYFLVKETGHNAYTFMIWFIIPAGAGICGFLASSGFYLGSLAFNLRPTKKLLAGVIVVAGLTQVMMYFSEYITMTLDDGTVVADKIGFFEYLKISLSHQTYQFYNHGAAMGNGVESGNWGYAIAAAQFIGSMIGGLSLFGFLSEKPYCNNCEVYFKRVGVILEKSFKDAADFDGFYKRLYSKELFSQQFLDELRTPIESIKNGEKKILCYFSLMKCSDCQQELFSQETKVLASNEYKKVKEFSGRQLVPQQTSIRTSFETKI